MNANLVSILTWTNPVKSGGYLIALNILLRVLHNQRPLSAVAVILLVLFIRRLWKHRIRPEVLVDPPDCEDWVNLSTYDFEKSAIDFGKCVFKSWVSLRSEHYLLWVIMTSVFWIVLAKVSSLVSFPTVLLLLSNGVFIAFPVLKNFRFEAKQYQSETDFFEPMETTALPEPETNENQTYKALQFIQDLSTSISSALKRNDPDGSTEDILIPLPDPSVALRERSKTPPEPESLTPFGAKIPSHEDSSEDEFLFDAAHFESSSSSTSNSFELLEF